MDGGRLGDQVIKTMISLPSLPAPSISVLQKVFTLKASRTATEKELKALPTATTPASALSGQVFMRDPEPDYPAKLLPDY